MMSMPQGALAVLASWWDILCAFFTSVVVYCQSGPWSKSGVSPAYDHISSPSPPPSCEEGTKGIHVDDLESGLNTAPLLLYKPIPRCSPPSSPTPPSTSGPATPATTSTVPILTSSFLSAFLLEGKGITLSPSAKAMLANGVWTADSSLASNFGRGEFDDSEETRVCSLSVVTPDSSPRLAIQHDLGAFSIPSGTFELELERCGEHFDLPRASPRPRPPSAVRHSLRFSMPPRASSSRPSPEINPDEVRMHSVATFMSLPGVNDVFRGALITDGDEVHLPTSLSSPEPHYHEFYYDYYCEEPVFALDSPTEDAIRRSLLAFSPALVIPPVSELSELNVSHLKNEEQPLSSTPSVPPTAGLMATPEHAHDEKPLAIASSTSRSASDSWHTPSMTSRRPSIESAISTSLFIFPAFPSTYTATSIATANEVQETAVIIPSSSSSSSSSSLYADSDTGSTSRDDPDMTLQTSKDAGYRKTDSNLSSGTRSISGSDGSLEMSGEATLVQVKRGSVVRPVIFMKVPGTRESLAPVIDECDTPDESATSAAVVNETDVRQSDTMDPCIYYLPNARESAGAFDGDEEEDGSGGSENESSVAWLKWPHGPVRDVPPRSEGTDKGTERYDVPEIVISPSPSTTVLNNNRQTGKRRAQDPHTFSNSSRRSNPATLQSNLRQLIISHIQDFIPAKLPNYHHHHHHGSSEASPTSLLSPTSQSDPTSGPFLRSSLVIQMDGAQMPMEGGVLETPQAPFSTLDGVGGTRFGVSLTFNTDPVYPAKAIVDTRYPTFIPADTPFPNPNRGRARAKSVPTRLRNAFGGGDHDTHDEDIGSSGSSETVNAGQAGNARIAATTKPRRRTRKTDAAERVLGRPRRTFIAAGEDSGQDDVPSDYSGARAL